MLGLVRASFQQKGVAVDVADHGAALFVRGQRAQLGQGLVQLLSSLRAAAGDRNRIAIQRALVERKGRAPVHDPRSGSDRALGRLDGVGHGVLGRQPCVCGSRRAVDRADGGRCVRGTDVARGASGGVMRQGIQILAVALLLAAIGLLAYRSLFDESPSLPCGPPTSRRCAAPTASRARSRKETWSPSAIGSSRPTEDQREPTAGESELSLRVRLFHAHQEARRDGHRGRD